MKRTELRLGELYTRAAQMFPEVIANTTDPRVKCSGENLRSSNLLGDRPTSTGCVVDRASEGLSQQAYAAVERNSACSDANQRCMLSLAGKFMGYAGTAKVVQDLVHGKQGLSMTFVPRHL